MKGLPNLLTGLRLVLALVVFFALAAAAGSVPGVAAGAALHRPLTALAFAAFVVAAVTDFFDGWLARRWDATSIWGAILDPIADKVLTCAAVLGLMALAPGAAIAVPGALILFREFAVSALREVIAPRGLKLPVTLLAKWKTTVQLVALGAEMAVAAWPGLGAGVALAAHALLWIAAAITLVTGGQYLAQAARALGPVRS
jgi:CDP-diacylglycerol--glycerol-3-phosphate 3-phosphatidyltransferase